MAEYDDGQFEAIRIEVALRDLGAHLDVPAPPEQSELTDAVRARLTGPAPPTRVLARRIAAAVVLVLLALSLLVAVSPPVRAGVLHLLRFAGVEFGTQPAPPGTLPTAVTLPGEREVDLPAARGLARFLVGTPDELGPPERVLLADGTPPRVVSLIYRRGTVRLDEFDGTLDIALFKNLVGQDGAQWTQVGEHPGIWVDRPHEVVYVDRAGNQHTESARLAARTLIWQDGDVTLRLEGDFTLDDALAVAGSVR